MTGKVTLDSLRGFVNSTLRRDYWDARLLTDPETRLMAYAKFAPDATLDVTCHSHYAMMRWPDEVPPCGAPELKDYDETCDDLYGENALNSLLAHSPDEACTELWNLIQGGDTLYDFLVSIHTKESDIAHSPIRFTAEIDGLDSAYEDENEGKKIVVLAAVNGEIVVMPAEVKNGQVRFEMDDLNEEGEAYEYSFTQIVLADASVLEKLDLHEDEE